MKIALLGHRDGYIIIESLTVNMCTCVSMLRTVLDRWPDWIFSSSEMTLSALENEGR